ncbi:MAG: nitroreductase family protein [Chloroflexi bacterium]|nr:nitroreductase family protein [Chloroflexota bacterium]
MPEVLDALSSRRARRAFSPSPIPAGVQETLWQAVALAPSHGNSQPWRLLVAESESVRQSLFHALSPGNQSWAGHAPLLVAVAAIPANDTVQREPDGTQRELWAFHAGIATGNLLAQATALGLIAHPMAGFDSAAVRAVFAAPPDLQILAVVAIGYPGDPDSLPDDLRRREDAPQGRLPLDILAARDRWSPAHATSMKEYRDRAAGPRA